MGFCDLYILLRGFLRAEVGFEAVYVLETSDESELDSVWYGVGPAVRSERVHEGMVAVSSSEYFHDCISRLWHRSDRLRRTG